MRQEYHIRKFLRTSSVIKLSALNTSIFTLPRCKAVLEVVPWLQAATMRPCAWRQINANVHVLLVCVGVPWPICGDERINDRRWVAELRKVDPHADHTTTNLQSNVTWQNRHGERRHAEQVEDILSNKN